MRLGKKIWRENEFGEPRYDRLNRKLGLYDIEGNPITLYEFETVDEHGQVIKRCLQYAGDVNDE